MKLKLQMNFQKSILIGDEPQSIQVHLKKLFLMYTFRGGGLYEMEHNRQVALGHFLNGKLENIFCVYTLFIVYKL